MIERSSQPFIPFTLPGLRADELSAKSKSLYQEINQRRSCRYFADTPVPKEVIENLILTASSAPSGAHKQPWKFVAISNAAVKTEIRKAAEAEEKEFYEKRAPESWLKDLAPLGTDWQKPFLETAPWLIVIFKETYEEQNGQKNKHYYVNESVGIAAGFLINAIHRCGLATLTHTPSPMNFLSDILKRPENEKPFLLLPLGYPAKDATVPNLQRKALKEVAVFV